MLLTLFMTAALGVASTPTTDDGSWIAEFARAQELAKESQRDMLVDFTGSDWCKYCKDLHAQVFSIPDFQKALAEDYVLVTVDLPRSAAAIARVPDIKANRALAQEHGIRSFPTVLMMTPDGDVYARTGFQGGGFVAYLKHVQDLRQEFRPAHVEALEVARKFATCPPEHKALFAAQALELMPKLPPASPLIPRLIPIIGHFAELDPNNEAGNLARALRVLLPSGYATEEQLALGRKLDPKNETGILELTVLAELYQADSDRETRHVAKAICALDLLGPIQEERAARLLYTNGAIWTDKVLRDTPRAKKLAAKAKPYVVRHPRLMAEVRRILAK